MREEDLLLRLTAEHRQAEAMFERMALHPAGDRARRGLLDEIFRVLGRHADAEEGFLYPVVRARLADGDRLADEKLAEHSRMKRRLEDLECLGAADPGFDEHVERLRAELARHTAEEENLLFPRVAAACAPADLDELGRRARAAHSDREFG